MTPFNLKIITPFPPEFCMSLNDKIFFDGQVENVVVRTTVGDKGILAKHEPYVAALPIGKMRVMIDGKFRNAAISYGTVTVDNNGDTIILTQSCEWSDEINIPRAEAAKSEAEELLNSDKTSRIEHEIAEFKLKRALNRLDAAGG